MTKVDQSAREKIAFSLFLPELVVYILQSDRSDLLSVVLRGKQTTLPRKWLNIIRSRLPIEIFCFKDFRI